MRISDWSSDVCSSDLVVTAAPITGTAQAGGSTTTAVLAALASAVDDAYLGMPIQHANVGTVGTVKGTSMIMDYNGTTKTAVLAETLGAAIVAGDYTIPANLTYVLDTLSTAPPLLSIPVRPEKRPVGK